MKYHLIFKEYQFQEEEFAVTVSERHCILRRQKTGKDQILKICQKTGVLRARTNGNSIPFSFVMPWCRKLRSEISFISSPRKIISVRSKDSMAEVVQWVQVLQLESEGSQFKPHKALGWA